MGNIDYVEFPCPDSGNRDHQSIFVEEKKPSRSPKIDAKPTSVLGASCSTHPRPHDNISMATLRSTHPAFAFDGKQAVHLQAYQRTTCDCAFQRMRSYGTERAGAPVSREVRSMGHYGAFNLLRVKPNSTQGVVVCVLARHPPT